MALCSTQFANVFPTAQLNLLLFHHYGLCPDFSEQEEQEGHEQSLVPHDASAASGRRLGEEREVASAGSHPLLCAESDRRGLSQRHIRAERRQAAFSGPGTAHFHFFFYVQSDVFTNNSCLKDLITAARVSSPFLALTRCWMTWGSVRVVRLSLRQSHSP